VTPCGDVGYCLGTQMYLTKQNNYMWRGKVPYNLRHVHYVEMSSQLEAPAAFTPGKRPFVRPECGLEDNIRMGLE